MNFDFLMPARIISGEGCVSSNAGLFTLGKSCIIVTGKSGAEKSGALGEVISVLDSVGVAHTHFNKIGENPLLSVCREGGREARDFGAEFVIGIGGGSALDAAKAVAAFAENPQIEGEDIFTANNLAPSLPIIAVPTTAGTGSETNRYSVLSLDGKSRKKTLNLPDSYPRYSFLDPRYTYSLGEEYTVSCALDAFCHCIESYLSPRSTIHSHFSSIFGAKIIWDALHSDPTAKETREPLLYAACSAGMAINTTGTAFPHPLGYNLTMYNGITHGRACAAFIGEYIACMSKTDEGKTLLSSFADSIGTTTDEIADFIPKTANVSLSIPLNTLEEYVNNVNGAGNYKNAPYVISLGEALEIYKRLFERG